MATDEKLYLRAADEWQNSGGEIPDVRIRVVNEDPAIDESQFCFSDLRDSADGFLHHFEVVGFLNKGGEGSVYTGEFGASGSGAR